MISIGRWLVIKDYLDQGHSISSLARGFGHDRKTIRKIAKSKYPFYYKKRFRK